MSLSFSMWNDEKQYSLRESASPCDCSGSCFSLFFRRKSIKLNETHQRFNMITIIKYFDTMLWLIRCHFGTYWIRFQCNIYQHLWYFRTIQTNLSHFNQLLSLYCTFPWFNFNYNAHTWDFNFEFYIGIELKTYFVIRVLQFAVHETAAHFLFDWGRNSHQNGQPIRFDKLFFCIFGILLVFVTAECWLYKSCFTY